MQSQHTIEQIKKEETLFEKVCRLARAKDENALKRLVQEGLCLGVCQNGYYPVELLAREGDVESVEFLINYFQASRNHAVQGYARGGHVREVDAQIVKGASRDLAVRGYAEGGHVREVDAQIVKGASRDLAVLGYAEGGHVREVNAQIAAGADRDFAVGGYAGGGYVREVDARIEKGASRDLAVLGYAEGGHVREVDAQIAMGANRNFAVVSYARGGHVREVNAQIAAGADRDFAVGGYARGGYVREVDAQIEKGASRDLAVLGYAEGGHVREVNMLVAAGASRGWAADGYAICGYVTKGNILSLIVHTDDLTLRKLLVNKAKINNPSFDVEQLMVKVSRLDKMMKEHQLNFHQASSLQTKGSRVWLLQGTQLVRRRVDEQKTGIQKIEGVFPWEIYIHISSFVLGLSSRDTQIVLQAVHKNLFMGVEKTILSNFETQGIFSHYQNQYKQAEDNYQIRLGMK